MHRSSDSAIVQLVFVREKVSVAAVNRDTSVELGAPDDLSGCMGLSLPDVLEGISFGSWVDVIGACSPVSPLSPGCGGDGDLGIWVGSWDEMVGALSVSEALRKF